MNTWLFSSTVKSLDIQKKTNTTSSVYTKKLNLQIGAPMNKKMGNQKVGDRYSQPHDQMTHY